MTWIEISLKNEHVHVIFFLTWRPMRDRTTHLPKRRNHGERLTRSCRFLSATRIKQDYFTPCVSVKHNRPRPDVTSCFIYKHIGGQIELGLCLQELRKWEEKNACCPVAVTIQWRHSWTDANRTRVEKMQLKFQKKFLMKVLTNSLSLPGRGWEGGKLCGRDGECPELTSYIQSSHSSQSQEKGRKR